MSTRHVNALTGGSSSRFFFSVWRGLWRNCGPNPPSPLLVPVMKLITCVAADSKGTLLELFAGPKPILVQVFGLRHHTALTWQMPTGPCPFGSYQVTAERCLFAHRDKWDLPATAMGKMQTVFTATATPNSGKPACICPNVPTPCCQATRAIARYFNRSGPDMSYRRGYDDASEENEIEAVA